MLEYIVFNEMKEDAMSTLTMRIDDADAAVVRKYAMFEGKTISDFIRDAVFEKIEDQEDLTANHAGEWRYRVGSYRILCVIQDDRLVIEVFSVGHRSTVYEG